MQRCGAQRRSAPRDLLKPLIFAAFRDEFEGYADDRASTLSALPAASGDIDRALASLRGSEIGALPKGLAPDSLELVVRCLHGADKALSAQDVASRVAVSQAPLERRSAGARLPLGCPRLIAGPTLGR